MKKIKLVFLALLFLCVSSNAREVFDIRLPDNGQPKRTIPGYGAFVCCGGTQGGNCASDILDSYSVFTSRVAENFERLQKRWSQLYKEYTIVKEKSKPMTEFTIEKDIYLAKDLIETEKNSYLVEKKNKLTQLEADLNGLEGKIKTLRMQIELIK